MKPADVSGLRALCIVDFSVAPEALAYLQHNLQVEVGRPDRAAVLGIIQDFDVLWVQLDQVVDREILDRAQRLKVVCTATTGTDHIDKGELQRRGIRLLSLKDDQDVLGGFTATAECAFMLMLACARHLRAALESVADGQWPREKLCGTQLSGRTLGIVGLGRLGSILARIALGAGMRVLACDVRPRKQTGVTMVNLPTLLRDSDLVSLHVHLDESTRHLIDAQALAQSKSGAILVNTSRGDVVDELAVVQALEDGRLAAYGADVIQNEWRPDLRESPLVSYAQSHNNVVITPHIGGATVDTIAKARLHMARKLVHYLNTGEEGCA